GVIHDEHLRRRVERQDLADLLVDVLPFVVRGNDDHQGHRRVGRGSRHASSGSPRPRESRKFTCTSSASTSNGLERSASASSSPVRSRSVRLADMAMIGRSFVSGSRRRREMRVPPSTPGSMMSMRMRSGSQSRDIIRPWAPSRAIATVYPSPFSTTSMSWATSSWSSTTRIREDTYSILHDRRHWAPAQPVFAAPIVLYGRRFREGTRRVSALPPRSYREKSRLWWRLFQDVGQELDAPVSSMSAPSSVSLRTKSA